MTMADNERDLRLIEDYLPIEAISAEASREKSVRKGHISTLHLWWARRPLVACRAAVYGALVPADRWVNKIDVKNPPADQEFVLRWVDAASELREVVRQQWNFSPGGSAEEVEDYRVDLPGVVELELVVTPDTSGGESPASLAELRVA
jgi:hypothetical protein